MDDDTTDDTSGATNEDAPRPRTFGRRRFLIGSGLGLGAVAATAWIRPSALFGSSSTSDTTTAARVIAPANGIIVNVFLRGAADGLSLLPPLGDATLQRLRPGVAVPDEVALPLDGRFGLHPAFANVHRMFTTGRAAFVPAAGSPSPIRSHFSAQALMDHGVVGGPLPATGWLGRYLTATAGDDEDALRAISIGTSMQPSLAGGGAIATPNLQSMALAGLTDGWSATRSLDTASALNALTDHDALRDAGTSAIDVLTALAPIASSAAPPKDWPTGFGSAFWSIAELLATGFPVEVATVDLGGWDVHRDMGAATDPAAAQHRLAASLDAAIGAFFTHIGALADRTTVVVGTEFGRRIALNGSGGTDHGRGMAMMVLGAGVRPGVHGDWPGLVDTDDGDVRVVNDHRRVLAEVLARRGREVDAGPVFPGFDTSSTNWIGVLEA